MKILLAVSGGIDSMYLARRRSLLLGDAEFGIAHCNFSLRGAESDGDEEFVRGYAQDEGLEFHVKRFDTVTYASSRGISVEMAARELRYAFFEEVCESYGYNAVAIAHNADDNAETLLLNMLRGCGLRGLCGMRNSRLLRGSCEVLRPMLGVSREEITQWMTENGYTWREDSTNATDNYKRNILRHNVLPVFKQINPSYLSTLRSDMSHAAMAQEVLEDYTSEALSRIWDGTRLDVKGLIANKHWEYLLWAFLEPYDFPQGTYESLCKLIEDYSNAPAGTFTFSGKTFPGSRVTLKTGPDCVFFRIYASGSRKYELSQAIVARSEIPSVKAPAGTVYFDADKVKLPLSFRPWQDGDRISPIGMKGSVKVSDLFGNLGLTSEQKNQTPIVTDATGRLICVFPYRTDRSVMLTGSTERVIVVR